MPVPPAAVHTTAVTIAAVAAAVTAAAAAHQPWSQLRGYTLRSAQHAVQPTKLFIAVCVSNDNTGILYDLSM